MTDGIAIGVTLITAISGGTSSNVFTYLARGNITLSICITGITTLLCLFSTPFFLDLTAGHFMPAYFVMPTATIVTEIALTLLLLLFIGMLILNFARKYVPLVAKFGIRGKLFFLLLIVIGLLSAGRLSIDDFGWTNLGLIVLLIAVFLLAGLLASNVFGFSRNEGVFSSENDRYRICPLLPEFFNSIGWFVPL
jgi:BASS family bile acid:Na+ symporter